MSAHTAFELGDRSPVIARLLQAAFDNLEKRFRDAIERARSANEIATSVDPVHTARAGGGCGNGLLSSNGRDGADAC